MSDADAFVFFGAPGDLAYEQIFPALQALTQSGRLNMPVVGVAKPDWTALGAAQRPVFYLAIPPSLFATVATRLGRSLVPRSRRG